LRYGAGTVEDSTAAVCDPVYFELQDAYTALASVRISMSNVQTRKRAFHANKMRLTSLVDFEVSAGLAVAGTPGKVRQ